VVRFRYAPGDLAAQSGPERLLDLPGGGYHQHWTRDLVFSADGRTLFVSVGSQTNASPEPDARRGAVSAYDPDGRHARIYAAGLRNAVGLAVQPGTGVLYAVINERDELGDDLVPDYLTSVRDGAFYGWPYSYFGAHADPRLNGAGVELVQRAVVPDVSLGPHVAALGLLFYTGATFPEPYRGDALVSLHGSWNRARRVGYAVVRARFRDGHPTGELEDFVTGWALPDGTVWGRPVGLLQLADGSVLVVDDGSETIWRVAYAPG
jgi:glucose/arabinose dehydrogenase